ncbi:helix-turn-helix domain-containing protein [Methylobacterium tarhaniae]|uniref:helix-turn-helix domain-containing protein n=1 Tax=Methylobacterium tarhaniae TaxID=1187852 RepID=UPI003D01EEE0
MQTESCSPPRPFLGQRFASHLGLSGDFLHHSKHHGQLRIGVTRLTGYRSHSVRSPPTTEEDAFSIHHLLRRIDLHERWQGRRQIFGGSFAADTVSVLDLRESAQCVVKGEIDAIQYYVPRQALNDFAYENDARPVARLDACREAPDPTIASLSRLLLSALGEPSDANGMFVEQVCLSLLAHFTCSYGEAQPGSPCIGGLAAWQERRAREIMHARFATRLTITCIARDCGLTSSHFARAFRQSTGQRPHQYLTNVRIEQAKELMRDQSLSLSDIALLCGFGDQSYFTRTFTRMVGTSPGQWRRSHLA